MTDIDPVREKYERTVKAACEECNRTVEAAREERERVKRAARAEYYAATMIAQEEEGRKCVVRDCPNRSGGGTFVGPLCSPCARALAGQRSVHSAKRIITSVLRGIY